MSMSEDLSFQGTGTGHLTRDAELKFTSGGIAVCKFAIAINKRRKHGDGWELYASFFDCVLWGPLGESLNKYLVKGKHIAIRGELHQNRWEQDGQMRSKIEIIIDDIRLLPGSRKDAPADPGSGGRADDYDNGYQGVVRNHDDPVPF